MLADLSKSAKRRAWRSAGAPILVLVLIVAGLASALVANFARQQDREFQADSVLLVQSALDERARAVANQAWDYGNWDDAYLFASASWNQDWVDSNYYTSIADGLIVLRPGEATYRHIWFSDAYLDGSDRIAVTVLHAARADVSAPWSSTEHTRSAQLVVDGRLAFYSVAPIRLADGSAEVKDYVVILEIFEPNEIAEIATARGLHAALFLPAPIAAPADAVALPLANGDAPLGALVWRDEKPGSATFIGQLWPIVLALIGVGALTLLVTRRLVAANVETAAQAEAALESSRIRAEFISTMSHELRTPLNAIIGYAELIEEEAGDGPLDAAQMGADAGHVLNAARHLRRMIDDILDHSRFEAGRMRLVIERLPIDALLAGTEEVIAPLAKTRGNTLVVRNAVGDYDLMGDELRVRQCLINLAGNANKFTENGSVSITARLEHDGEATHVVFDIADTGVGIESAMLEKLFRPFVQVHSTNHSGYGGAGLGLSISRKLARAMGGDITVKSEFGVGSTFSLSAPAEPALVEARAVAAAVA